MIFFKRVAAAGRLQELKEKVGLAMAESSEVAE
jgi:hypothetical protein